ncbi:MAG: aminopeptidase P N-terminal domain-containing protein [Candidatus Binatia bacterium]|nr:aminopeptidase P N-terminal domain-containing protein [Candidatus Binatia bacterium]
MKHGAPDAGLLPRREVSVVRPFPTEVYADRRRRFMEQIGANAAALFVAAPVALRSHDVEYPYRPDNDLLYLTGFPEPESACLLLPGHPEQDYVLFVRPYDSERQVWVGGHAGVEGAVREYGARRAYPIQQIDEVVGELVSQREELFFRFGRDPEWNRRVVGWMRQWQELRPRSGRGPVSLRDPAVILHEMRLRKEPVEVERMRVAAQIAAEGHCRALREVRPGMYEFEVEALLDSTFRSLGASGPAYPSIVAAGANATVLHYTHNDCPCLEGQLLLIDAGAEYAFYCSDITRTFPIGRRFSPPQRDLYEVVLAAQKAAIEVVRPGARYDEPHRRAVEVLVDGLVQLHLLTGSVEENIAQERYRRFFMHRTSHWLGMDVHDVGMYKCNDEFRKLEPGFVLTVEPGLYIGEDCADVPAEFRGIGIRIEDDVLVTPEGREVLTASVPKEVVEIEALRREAVFA